RIKLTLLRTAADPADLAVTVDGTASVADLARAIAETDPVPTFLAEQELRDLTLRVHGTPGTEDRSTRLLLPEDSAAEVVRSGSTVSLAQAAGRYDGTGGDRPAAARLTVVDGPDAGLEVTLPEGTSIIGRGKGCDVRLSDPTVSKEHARLAVTDIIELVDLRSANGLLMGDGLVQRAALLPEDTVTLGDTTIQVARIAASRHAAPGAAHVEFNRSPRLAPVYAGEEHEAPKPPEPPKPT